VTRVVGYIRVSTDKQAEHGVSLEAQEAKLRAYAALYDLEIIALEVDAGESASSLERPALKRALAMLRGKKADALLVVKLDRLTRSVRDLADLVDRYFASGKKALLSVGEQIDTRTAAGRGVLNILGSVGQMERELIGERTAAAMAHLRTQGRRCSGIAPYGYRFAQDAVEADPLEQAGLAAARELRAAGLSLRAVAATLAERGIMARCGRPWGARALAGALARE
jgi:site-specific DNA recombinase